MTTKELFESIGFDGYYRTETENFYYKYFKSELAMHQFIIEVLKNDDDNNTHRRMINQVRRFVELANDIEIIRPGCDPLKIMFLRFCLESLSKLSNCDAKKGFYKIFSDCFSEDGKIYILDNFRFNGLAIQKDGPSSDYENIPDVSYNLTINDFFNAIKIVRGRVAHEGNYWQTQFFSRNPECPLSTHIYYNKKFLDDFDIPKNNKMVCYKFLTTMQYETFIGYFVEGCVNYILKFVRGGKIELP